MRRRRRRDGHGNEPRQANPGRGRRSIGATAALLPQRGLPDLGAGPAGDDAPTLRVVEQPAADAAVRFRDAATGAVFAVELLGARGGPWTGVFPAAREALEEPLRRAVESLRFVPPQGP